MSLACHAPLAPTDSEGLPTVVSVTTLTTAGGRLDWSATHNLIVYDGPDEAGTLQLHTMRPDGTAQRCLTCDHPAAPPRNKGNPAWHPGGEWIVFQALQENFRGNQLVSNPGGGKANDLWVMTRDGARFHQLTDVGLDGWTLHPHFSRDGKRLVWSERVGGGTLLTGEWALMVADFVSDADGARLERVERYQPLGPVFYESHQWSEEDDAILFSAFLETDSVQQSWMDLYSLDLSSGDVSRLTESVEAWDEHGHRSPDGTHLAWVASYGCECNPRRTTDRTLDLWIMNADGTQRAQLTHLSDPAFPEYVGADTRAGDNAWGPDGKQIALYVIEDYGLGAVLGLGERGGHIVRVDLAPQLDK